jgi:hypothetical protein
MTNALAAALIAALAGCAWLWFLLDGAQDELVRERAAVLAVALRHAENARNIEDGWRGRIVAADRRREADRVASERAAAAVGADVDRLRDPIQAYAAGTSEGAPAACSERAATLGRVLDRVLRDAASCTRRAEDHAADVRRLLGGWPPSPAEAASAAAD